ncbi:MAG: hypothetical protein ACRD2J_14045 [Thermoanaerobaculia bacterium]
MAKGDSVKKTQRPDDQTSPKRDRRGFGSTATRQSPDDFDGSDSADTATPKRDGFGSTSRTESPDDQEPEQ